MTDQPSSLAEALAILQTRLPRIGKEQVATIQPGRDAKPGARAFGYKYAGLAAVSEALLPELGKVGLSFSAKPTLMDGGRFCLIYTLRHQSGEEDTGEYPLPPPDAPPRTIGSAITYGRRYCLCAVTGAAPAEDDDDAAEAQAQAEHQEPRYRSAYADPEHQRLVHGSDERIVDRGRAIRRKGPDDESRTWEGPPGDLAAPTAPEDSPGTASNEQKRDIVREFDRLGITDRIDRLAETRRQIGRQIESSRNLSMTEAAKVIKNLKAVPTPDKAGKAVMTEAGKADSDG